MLYQQSQNYVDIYTLYKLYYVGYRGLKLLSVPVIGTQKRRVVVKIESGRIHVSVSNWDMYYLLQIS